MEGWRCGGVGGGRNREREMWRGVGWRMEGWKGGGEGVEV